MWRECTAHLWSVNDIIERLEYDNFPLKIILPSDGEECDEKELQKSREKNRKFIERMRNDKKDSRSAASVSENIEVNYLGRAGKQLQMREKT